MNRGCLAAIWVEQVGWVSGEDEVAKTFFHRHTEPWSVAIELRVYNRLISRIDLAKARSRGILGDSHK